MEGLGSKVDVVMDLGRFRRFVTEWLFLELKRVLLVFEPLGCRLLGLADLDFDFRIPTLMGRRLLVLFSTIWNLSFPLILLKIWSNSRSKIGSDLSSLNPFFTIFRWRLFEISLIPSFKTSQVATKTSGKSRDNSLFSVNEYCII